jgi:hypothetical protein
MEHELQEMSLNPKRSKKELCKKYVAYNLPFALTLQFIIFFAGRPK